MATLDLRQMRRQPIDAFFKGGSTLEHLPLGRREPSRYEHSQDRTFEPGSIEQTDAPGSFIDERVCPGPGQDRRMHQKPFVRRSWLAAACGAVLLTTLTGCDEGSISDENPYNHAAYVGGHAREIDELDLLGSHGTTTEGDIQSALRSSQSGGVRAPSGSSLLVVQSGAAAPDSIMLAAIEKSYRVFPFSGVAVTDRHRDGSLGRDLRLAAARSGCAHILCYWGKLESIREDAVTKTVSWVPIVGGLIPDEQRTTRLRVRAILIDVASGRAVTFTPPAEQNSAISASLLRAGSHDKQLYELKTRAYAGLVSELTGQAG